MEKYFFDLTSADSEAANPCPSLFGEDSGVIRDDIAGCKKGVPNQAPRSNTTDFEVFKKFRIIKNMRNISVFRYLHRLEPEICKNPKKTYEYYKCLNTYVATSRWRVVSLNKKKKTLHIRILCFKNGVAKYFWRSILKNIQNKEYRVFKNKHLFTLQENSILNVQAREERLETGYLDELDRSSARENLADITYISPCSSVEDNFDDVFCVNEATTYSATEQSDIEHKKLSEKEVVQGCELPFKIR